MTVVLGIDPGYDRLGVAVITKESGREKLLYSTCFLSNKKQSLSARLLFLGDQLEKTIVAWQPEIAAVEKLYFSVNQKTALAVAEARGMISYLCAKNGLTIHEYAPTEIKLTLTGYGHADKKQIGEMIPKLLKDVPPARFDDETDAIAIALTCLAKKIAE